MEYLLGAFLGVPFLYWNYKILQTDIKEKRIPNRYLLFLLCIVPFWYVYGWYFGYFQSVNIGIFLLQIFLSLLVGFLLYYFGKWGAGDAKYLLVLNVFIPHIGIIPFVFSIAIITILYLLGYFLWFWFGPNLWNTQRRRDLYMNLWKMKKEEFFTINKEKKKKETYVKVLKSIHLFLIIFISIRLFRLYILEYITKQYEIISSPKDIILFLIQDSIGIFILVGIIMGILILFLVLRYILGYIYVKSGDYGYKINGVYAQIFASLVLGIFLIYEYIIAPDIITQYLWLICTIYLIIALFIKVMLFAYKLVFVVNEESLIHINNLKTGMNIDLGYLIKNLKHNVYIKESGIDIHQIDITDIQYIRELYKKVNQYHLKQKTPHYEDFEYIKILNTFSFGIYIYLGFLLCFLWKALFIKILSFL